MPKITASYTTNGRKRKTGGNKKNTTNKDYKSGSITRLGGEKYHRETLKAHTRRR